MQYSQALDLIKQAHYVLIATHLNPDADTISSALALSNFMFENKINHKVYNKSKELPSNLNFLDRFDKITDQLPKSYDLIIYVDCANTSRVGVQLANDVAIINFDHHKSNDNFGKINIVNDNFASCAEVIFEFFSKNNLKVSKKIAQCLYTGIYSDSLQFSVPRSSKKTFEVVNELVGFGVAPSYVADMLNRRDSLAKYRLLPKILDSLQLHFEGKVATIYVLDEWLKQTGAHYSECEDVVDMILNIAIVDVAIFLRVSNGKTRVSFRSKNNYDVSVVANHFNGGGHTMAAGCSCDTTDLFETMEHILQFIKGTDE